MTQNEYSPGLFLLIPLEINTSINVVEPSNPISNSIVPMTTFAVGSLNVTKCLPKNTGDVNIVCGVDVTVTLEYVPHKPTGIDVVDI